MTCERNLLFSKLLITIYENMKMMRHTKRRSWKKLDWVAGYRRMSAAVFVSLAFLRMLCLSGISFIILKIG